MNGTNGRITTTRVISRMIPLAVAGAWLLVGSAHADCSYDANGVGYGDTCQNENSNGAGGYRAPTPNYNYYYQLQMMRQRQLMLQRQQYLAQQRQLYLEQQQRIHAEEQHQKELEWQKARAQAAAQAQFIAKQEAAAQMLKGGSCCSSQGLKTGDEDADSLKTGTGSALFNRPTSNPRLRGEGPLGDSGKTAFDNLKAWAGASEKARHAATRTGASELAGVTPDKGGGFAGAAPEIKPPPTPPAAPVVPERVARDPEYRRLTANRDRDQRVAARDRSRVNELLAKKAHATGTDLQNIEVELANASNQLSAAQNKVSTDDVQRANREKQIENVYEVPHKRSEPAAPPVPKLAPGVH